MTDEPGTGSDYGQGGGLPPIPPMAPGQYGGGGSYPGAQSPYEVPPTYPGPGAPGQPGMYPGQPGQPGSYPGQPGQPGMYPGQPGMYPPPPGYGSLDPNAPRGRSGWAIAAFFCGLLLPLVGILLAVPFGIVALVKISRTHVKGTWLAIIGMVLSVLWWVGVIVVGVVAVNNQAQRDDSGAINKVGTIAFSDVRVGDCVNIGGLQGGGIVDKLTGVPCANAHDGQAYSIVPLAESQYPGETAVAQEAKQACGPAFAPYAATGREPYYVYPTQSLWNESGGHRAICFVINDDKQPMTGSVVK